MDPYDVESYSYDLPEAQIAQAPAARRDGSRLMRVVRGSGEISHLQFSDLPDVLRPGDLLVMNDTRVYKARLVGKKIGGGAAAEVFCLGRTEDPGVWRALVRPGRHLPPGSGVELEDGSVVAIGERLGDGLRLVRLPSGVPAEYLFESIGRLPLPPYIKNSAADEERYQTVYSDREKNASAAAPTAGLHFTEAMLADLEARGIAHAFVTLDVGLGTFRPVKVRDVRDHTMHGETCRIAPAQAELINGAIADGRRIIAVGTTAVRTIESFASAPGRVEPGERTTEIFIYPGFDFKVTDAMITNFHLPRSTLLMLVAAFAGHETTLAAYRRAVEHGYRFFSFGDAMLIE
ncbi:MAG: tRNA preQ1(34) S-adenosylmethionine ribosyltransferase-isomerase QueA [Synergistaceae bacterium]|nr:tRNA preQ1(34) S-adenosylmethionine ribosyltransferase-isomerase QueA [Synergistaceae bacterium]